MVALRLVVAEEVNVAVNAAEVDPAGTVTEEGTLRLLRLSESATTAPRLGAAPVSATVQVLVLALLTAPQASDESETVAGAVIDMET